MKPITVLALIVLGGCGALDNAQRGCRDRDAGRDRPATTRGNQDRNCDLTGQPIGNQQSARAGR